MFVHLSLDMPVYVFFFGSAMMIKSDMGGNQRTPTNEKGHQDHVVKEAFLALGREETMVCSVNVVPK